MDKPTKPEPKAAGENPKGKYHYNPVGMAGKTEGAEDPSKPKGHDEETHRREEKAPAEK